MERDRKSKSLKMAQAAYISRSHDRGNMNALGLANSS